MLTKGMTTVFVSKKMKYCNLSRNRMKMKKKRGLMNFKELRVKFLVFQMFQIAVKTLISFQIVDRILKTWKIALLRLHKIMEIKNTVKIISLSQIVTGCNN
jgi:hypothetical protein